MSAITHITGAALPLRGHDIDTDRIMPARFLKAVTFEGLEHHLFEDDRRADAVLELTHPFDNPVYRAARVLLANANFGCGSSREHAPQALKRWGISVVVAESLAEIFFTNALVIGLPCVTVSRTDIERLMAMTEAHPATEFVVDLAAGFVSADGLRVPAALPDSARDALISGRWDATGLLLENYADVERVAARLPPISSFLAPRDVEERLRRV